MINPRRLRAPAQDGAFTAIPALDEAGPLIASNRHRLQDASFAIFDLPLPEVRRRSAAAALAAARDYLREAGEPWPDLPAHGSIILAGHQPELFHPGVWVKNFALNGLARAHDAIPINLVVDNDVPKTTSLPVPAIPPGTTPDGAPGKASIHHVPFDRRDGDVPYEERDVLDEDLFRSLDDRALSHARGWGFSPLLPEFWARVRERSKRTKRLGERIAAARRGLERSWGCHNVEVPLSFLCRTEPFAWFAAHVLVHINRFHAAHNDSLRAYRRLYGLRSPYHPVPDLAAEGDWREAPFWVWSRRHRQRSRLMARAHKGGVDLRLGNEATRTLEIAQGSGSDAVASAWRELERQGIRIRTRALTTTLFGRMFVADTFLHGIGGAKYDEVTDEIVRRFYGIEPPDYLVLSATLYLPLPRYAATTEDCRRLAHRLHDLRCNPQRHLNVIDLKGDAAALAEEKQNWIQAAPDTRRARRLRFEALRDLTAKLQPFLADRAGSLERELARCRQQIEFNAVVNNREFAFCLFPESVLRPFCSRFLQVVQSDS